ncbi:uncharacterized protein LOC8068539 [Sorghum bicolor]|uniref:uncharacterized protein LOC8068539 n=1 Tax=Sorghum bicolor TaxID=4558 RepID=UPI000B42414D|nr:uncharacterized protein LOC8068539 [Sorghum bicolor]|eukprot:XP_021320247.1 uncharacterized protein LOC8068539 [Sorghum bicolor]
MAAPLPLVDGVGPQVDAPAPLPLVDGVGPQVDGLPNTLNLLLRTATSSPNHPDQEQRNLLRASLLPVIVCKIKVRDAGPFMQLVRLPLAAANPHGNRTIPNRLAIERVAAAANVLFLLIDPLLPCLRRHPTDPTHLRGVKACAERLQHLAAEAGGSFKTSCSQFAQRIILYVTQAHAHPMFSPYAPLRSSIDDIIRRATVLLDLTVTVKHPEPGELAAAAVEVAAYAAQYGGAVAGLGAEAEADPEEAEGN